MKDLTNGNISRNFIKFSIPVLIGTLMSLAFNLVDTVIAGKMLGEQSLAAISSLGTFVTVITCTMSGIVNGATGLLSKNFGAKQYRYFKYDVITTLIAVVSIDVILSILCVSFVYPLMRVMRVDTAITEQAALYFRIYMGGLVFIQLDNTFVCVLHSMGISLFPMIMSIVAGCINLAGNIISALVLPKNIAVGGIAAFSVFAAFVADAVMTIKICKCIDSFGVKECKYKFKFSRIKIIFHFGGPSMLQQFIMYISGLVLSPIINSVGYTATAGYAVANKIYNVCANSYGAFSKVLGTFVAQCSGAKKYSLIKKGFRINLLQCAGLTVPILVFASVFAEKICGLFFKPEDYGGISHIYATDFVRYFLPFVVINMFAHEVHSFCRGIVKLNWLNIMTATGSGSRILFGLLFGLSTGALSGVYGVYLGWVLCWVFEAFVGIYVMFRYRTEERIKKAVISGYDV